MKAFVAPILAPTINNPQGAQVARQQSQNAKARATEPATKVSWMDIGLGTATMVAVSRLMTRQQRGTKALRARAAAVARQAAVIKSSVDSSLDTYFEFGDDYFFYTEDQLGAGAYGKVFKCKNKNKEGDWAVKWVFAGDLEQLENEVAAHKHLGKHPHVGELVAAYDREGYTDKYIVMELINGGELGELIEKRGKQTEEWCKGVFKQVFQAVQHLHSKKVLHRDLKADNFLVVEDAEHDKDHPNIKLIDFGASKWCKDGPFEGKKYIGTTITIAPEVIFARGDEFDAGDESQIETTHEIVYKKRPFGIRKYRGGADGIGAKVNIVGDKPRYPGDPIGQAFAAGIEVDWAVKTVNGMDVTKMTMDDIIDTMGDRLLDNSSRGAFDGSFKVTGDNKGKGKIVPTIEPVELPVTVVYAQMKPRPYGPACDVWSLGSILYTLITGEPPFGPDEEKVLAGVYPPVEGASAELVDLIAKMLVLDPKKRATMDEVGSHPWLQ
eukprot:CAMPEP_0172656000 /NCGR_PEP_ID=MMETSP1074-20121228/1045_1 /TAXON_ID=2916 /ORGANISM="Ceratium fusus, Strain PA161109" /LENGTH=494 /DNA_ID=CAMNT_0013470749 /DNA_START=84 /DNA_END=1568 /DNA_ORIENTATION=-